MSNFHRRILSSLSISHLEKIREYYNSQSATLLWPAEKYRQWLAHYYNLIIPAGSSVLEIGCGAGHLLARLHTRNVTGIDISENQLSAARARIPYGNFFLQAGEKIDVKESFDYIILSDTLNLAADVQLLLENIQDVADSHTRLLINFPSSLWRPVYSLASLVGLRARHPQSSWLALGDIKNLLHLSEWEPIKFNARILLPWAPWGLDALANRWLAPLLPWFCLGVFCIARKSRSKELNLTVSVVIPARNEAGNIEAAVRRLPEMGAMTEIILIEGHSRDDTWSEIQRVQKSHPEKNIKIMRQSGEGKGNAVREAFAASTGDVLMILDADLTVPPEELPKFYAVLSSGKGEFANGVRLVYPMEKQAMRFLNLCANNFFSLAFSWLLDQPIKDTLCGTKVLLRTHYEHIAANRDYFGDFDPFGDFDLLFGADKINLKITDVPIRYQDRTYGTTNIHRWRHGVLLVRMMIFGARKLKFI